MNRRDPARRGQEKKVLTKEGGMPDDLDKQDRAGGSRSRKNKENNPRGEKEESGHETGKSGSERSTARKRPALAESARHANSLKGRRTEGAL